MSDGMRASDAEREQAVARLRDASAEGRLTLEELAERTEHAYAATTHGELVEVTADLPAAATVPARRSPLPGIVFSVFAPVRRRRRRRLPAHTIVFTVFAPVTLDLRETALAAETATIELLGVFAPLTVIVPPHVEVDTVLLPIFAPVLERGSPGDVRALAPRIRIVGISVFAPVFVRYADS